MKIDVYSSDGSKKGTVDLPESIFEVAINEGLIHEAMIRQQANARVATAVAKTRSNVKGGGHKPWRQKGTGRARQGSIRSAQWRGGGVIFGPNQERNFEKQMPKKMRRKALLGALSAKAKSSAIVALESFESDAPKTTLFAGLLEKMDCSRKTLVVTPERMDVLEKSARNIPRVKTIFAQYLNIVDILSADRIIFLTAAIKKTEEIFSDKK